MSWTQDVALRVWTYETAGPTARGEGRWLPSHSVPSGQSETGEFQPSHPGLACTMGQDDRVAGVGRVATDDRVTSNDMVTCVDRVTGGDKIVVDNRVAGDDRVAGDNRVVGEDRAVGDNRNIR